MIDKWLKKLELTDWIVELESINYKQVLYDKECPPDERYFIGVRYNINTKYAVIYHDRDLTEEDIIHELLHVKYNNWSEEQVNKETEKLLIKDKNER